MSGEAEALHQALLSAGEDVVLRRPAGTSPTDTHVDVTCRAAVRSYRLHTETLQSGVRQADWMVIISPIEIFATNWPGSSAALKPDPQLPRRLDQLIFHGTKHTIEAVDPIYVAGVLVRIEMHCMG